MLKNRTASSFHPHFSFSLDDPLEKSRSLFSNLARYRPFVSILGQMRATASKSDKTNDFKIGWWIGGSVPVTLEL
jgi:hypothetical protein